MIEREQDFKMRLEETVKSMNDEMAQNENNMEVKMLNKIKENEKNIRDEFKIVMDKLLSEKLISDEKLIEMENDLKLRLELNEKKFREDLTNEQKENEIKLNHIMNDLVEQEKYHNESREILNR
eukprot:UN14435